MKCLKFLLNTNQKGTCCEVFRGRGGGRLCSHQNGVESKVTRNHLPGASARGSLNAQLIPATTDSNYSFITFPWNCFGLVWPIRAWTQGQLQSRGIVGPEDGPWARRERIFPRTASGRRGRISHLEMLAGRQQTKWSWPVEPEKSAGRISSPRGSRHVSNIT